MYNNHEVIELLDDFPEKNLYKSMTGTIVLIYYRETNIPVAYEIEFFNQSGRMIALETFEKHEMTRVKKIYSGI